MTTGFPYQLIATDLDGTLLRSDESVSARTRDALAAATAAGAAHIVVTGATISLVKMIVGRLIGLDSRYTTEPSSISGPIARSRGACGTIVAGEAAEQIRRRLVVRPGEEAHHHRDGDEQQRQGSEDEGPAPAEQGPGQPGDCGSYIRASYAATRYEKTDSRDSSDGETVCSRMPWSLATRGSRAAEAAEVDGLDAQRALGEVDLDAGRRRVGDQRGREGTVVAGTHQIAVRPVGHQASDLAEVTAGGVPAGDDDLDVPGELLDLFEDVGREQHRAALVAHAPQQVHELHALASISSLTGSMPLVGSSRKTSGGSWTSADAIFTRCLMPVE
ncbi:hypothetical protein SVIOM74S_04732 [Streptomyces violarus]